jgi:hypothetical protein
MYRHYDSWYRSMRGSWRNIPARETSLTPDMYGLAGREKQEQGQQGYGQAERGNSVESR